MTFPQIARIINTGPFIEEKIMHLWLADRLVRHNLEVKQFFNSAYKWRYGKDAQGEHDVLGYHVGGIIPQYVREYIIDIQQKER